MRTRANVITLLFLSCVARQLAPAQDFYGAGVSARTAATAGIYLPSSSNVLDALTLNPAGLTALTGPTLNLSAAALFATGSFGNSSNTNSPMQRTAGLVPFGAFGAPLGHSRWSFGVGVAPDALSSANWRYNDSPGTAGAYYGSQIEKSAIHAYRSSAGVGFSILPNFAIGATVAAVYNSNTLDAPYTFQNQPVLKGLKTLLDLHTSGIGWNTSVGVRGKPFRRIELGAAYKTKTTIESRGSATGTLNAQFAALGIAADPTFAYRARVKVVLPQSALASVSWQFHPRMRVSIQGDWKDWSRSFQQLPVTLTKGTNAVVNRLLGTDSLSDRVPLDWKQQFTIRAGVERRLGENLWASGGFQHGNNPVPGSTLSPLTAAIMQNGLSTGAGYTHGPYRFDLAYGIDLTANSTVNRSALLGGEYSHSRVSIETQAITLSMSFHI